MVLISECLKVGDKYYEAEEAQKIFDARINSVVPEDL